MTSFCLTNNGGIKGTFLTLMKALSIDQYAFAEVDGSDNLEDNQRWNFSFEDVMDPTKSLRIYYNQS